MANTLFNIFGSHSDDPVQKQLFSTNLGENAIAVKNHGAIPKGLTPSKISKNTYSPRMSSVKKKTFLHNEGIQAFRPLQKSIATPVIKKKLQIYEDAEPVHKHEEDEIKMEYNRKPIIDVSDDEFELSEDQVNKLVFGLPTNIRTPKFDKPKMIFSTDKNSDFDDLFVDKESDLEDNKFEISNLY